jgi:hypothetical protein
MQKAALQLQLLIERVRDEAKRRHARWDDEVYQHWVWQTGSLWDSLEKHPQGVREGSVLDYLELLAAGIGAGYIAMGAGAPRTLLEAFLGRMPVWFARTAPESHARIAATAWNLAEGARRQASWMEQYLLARVHELDEPLLLEQSARALLEPALEPQRDALWKGPFTVTVIKPAQQLQGFLPGELSMLTPSLIRIADRRRPVSVGVLLAPRGQSACIGQMDGTPPPMPLPPRSVPVQWASDRVTVAGVAVGLPLMACEPMHTLALASGYLLAVVPNSQRVWVVETP